MTAPYPTPPAAAEAINCGTVVKLKTKNFSIAQIASSGQCFRLNELSSSDKIWQVAALGKRLQVQELGNDEHIFHCSAREYHGIWKHYFDLERDYEEIQRLIMSHGDHYLAQAAEYGGGIRILNQDLWEVIVSFIISQRNSIPRIKSIVEKLCQPHGDSFPAASDLAKYSESNLWRLGMGYRAKYLLNISRSAADGLLDLQYLKGLELAEATKYLKSFHGIGEKVANCVALYGLHKLNAFPVDTWINKIIVHRYGTHFPVERFYPYAGVAQQYMFFYEKMR